MGRSGVYLKTIQGRAIRAGLLGLLPAVIFLSLLSGTTAQAAFFKAKSVTTSAKMGSEGYTCAIRSTGQAYCWGKNTHGELGNGGGVGQAQPVPVSGMSEMKAISAGNNHVCALALSGKVFCWGENNYGQLGDGTTSQVSVPVAVQGLEDAIAVAAGSDSSSCAVRATGQVVCWGRNNHRQLGDGTTDNQDAPVVVQAITDAVSITLGYGHACALRGNGAAVCWGRNDLGQLGDNTGTDRSIPGPVPGLPTLAAIDAGRGHTCGLDGTGKVYCWGWNYYGQVGFELNPTPPAPTDPSSAVATPTPVPGVTDAVAVTAGQQNGCAVLASGSGTCWGTHDLDAAGIGPVPIPDLADIAAIDAGGIHNCLIRAGGQTLCWGAGDYGQLGNGMLVSSQTPVSVVEPSGMPAVGLTVTAPDSTQGKVVSQPSGIDCGLVCSADYEKDTEVTLTAVPAGLHVFGGWTGSCEGQGNPCHLTMSEARAAGVTWAILIPDGWPRITKLFAPKKLKLKRGKKATLRVKVTSSGPRMFYGFMTVKSSNKQVKATKAHRVTIGPGKTKTVKLKVRATRKAKGKAKLTIKLGGKKAVTRVRIKR